MATKVFFMYSLFFFFSKPLKNVSFTLGISLMFPSCLIGLRMLISNQHLLQSIRFLKAKWKSSLPQVRSQLSLKTCCAHGNTVHVNCHYVGSQLVQERKCKKAMSSIYLDPKEDQKNNQ